jgi:hypothetical protein
MAALRNFEVTSDRFNMADRIYPHDISEVMISSKQDTANDDNQYDYYRCHNNDDDDNNNNNKKKKKKKKKKEKMK